MGEQIKIADIAKNLISKMKEIIKSAD